MQIFKCDVCKTIGEPGTPWIRINLIPFTISQLGCHVETVSYEELYLDACSIVCAILRIQNFDFIETCPIKKDLPSPTTLRSW